MLSATVPHERLPTPIGADVENITDEQMKSFDSRERSVIDSARILAKQARRLEDSARSMKRWREEDIAIKESAHIRSVRDRAYGSEHTSFGLANRRMTMMLNENLVRPGDLEANVDAWLEDVKKTAPIYRIIPQAIETEWVDGKAIARVEFIFTLG